MKKFGLVLLVLSLMCVPVVSQTPDDLMTVEEAYLNTIEGLVINEMLTSEGRDSKFVALQFIEDAISSGRDSEEIQKALYSLATIGLSTTVREDGRVINNYPDVRIKACELLGKAGNPEAKSTLVQVMYMDNEPSVITSAVRAIGEIGFDKDDSDVVEMVNWINKKFDAINPTSSLALEILNTYEKIYATVENKSGVVEGIMRIANNYSYVTPVRNRAREVLRNIAGGSSGK